MLPDGKPNQIEREVIDIIYQNIPLNDICPHCESTIDPSCIIDTSSAVWDYPKWIAMASKIVDAVKVHIQKEAAGKP